MMRFLLLTFLIFADIPSRRIGLHIQDFAEILTPADRAVIEQLTAATHRETTAEVAVVTVKSLNGSSIDEYSNRLFNTWGIGDWGRNNGVLFIVAPNERRARIEVGSGLEQLLTDSRCGQILDENVIPFFKKGDFPGGMLAGTRALTGILLRNREVAMGVPGALPKYLTSPKQNAKNTAHALIGVSLFLFILAMINRKRRSYGSTLFLFTALSTLGLAAFSFYTISDLPRLLQPREELFGGFFLAAASLFYNARQFLRFGRNRCVACSTPLTLLSEKDDDKYLSEAQRLEESLGAIDYDVWVCPACLKTDVEKYVGIFSSFKDCPSCARRTFTESSVTLVHATRYSPGLRQVNGQCMSCKHKTSREVPIPRIRHSSGSASSFHSGGGSSSGGGGSSSGGGASRGW